MVSTHSQPRFIDDSTAKSAEGQHSAAMAWGTPNQRGCSRAKILLDKHLGRYGICFEDLKEMACSITIPPYPSQPAEPQRNAAWRELWSCPIPNGGS